MLVQDGADAVEAILISQLVEQFVQATGGEPGAHELQEMLEEMKESGVYQQAAQGIAQMLGGMGRGEIPIEGGEVSSRKRSKRK
jgi:hypothetical protein